MIDKDDLGPPRRVFSVDEWCKEVDRQKRLVKSGDLRRQGGMTYAWCPLGKKHWRWLSTYSTTSGGRWPSRDNREQAWLQLLEDHYD